MTSRARGNGARFVAWVLGIAGVAAAGSLTWSLGVDTIARQLAALGRILPLVLLVTGLKYPAQAEGWRLALPRPLRPPRWPSLRATIAGDAVGYLTVAGPVTGEPLRAAMLRGYLPVPIAIAVGAVERAMYVAAGTVLVAAALLVVSVRSSQRGGTLAISIVLLAVAAAAGAVVRRGGGTAPAGRTARVDTWRDTLADLWTNRRPALLGIAGLCLLQHLLLLLEAWLMLDALDAAPSLATVVVFEGMTKLVNTAGAVVPGRLGIMEGGSAALAAAFNVGASLGLSLALMRRARALVWGVVGLGLWACEVFPNGVREAQ